jgi:hypothetical protein
MHPVMGVAVFPGAADADHRPPQAPCVGGFIGQIITLRADGEPLLAGRLD